MLRSERAVSERAQTLVAGRSRASSWLTSGALNLLRLSSPRQTGVRASASQRRSDARKAPGAVPRCRVRMSTARSSRNRATTGSSLDVEGAPPSIQAHRRPAVDANTATYARAGSCVPRGRSEGAGPPNASARPWSTGRSADALRRLPRIPDVRRRPDRVDEEDAVVLVARHDRLRHSPPRQRRDATRHPRRARTGRRARERSTNAYFHGARCRIASGPCGAAGATAYATPVYPAVARASSKPRFVIVVTGCAAAAATPR